MATLRDNATGQGFRIMKGAPQVGFRLAAAAARRCRAPVRAADAGKRCKRGSCGVPNLRADGPRFPPPPRSFSSAPTTSARSRARWAAVGPWAKRRAASAAPSRDGRPLGAAPRGLALNAAAPSHASHPLPILPQAEAKIVEFANRGYRALGIGFAEGEGLAGGRRRAVIASSSSASSAAARSRATAPHTQRSTRTPPAPHQARAAPTRPAPSGSSWGSSRCSTRRATTPPTPSGSERAQPRGARYILKLGCCDPIAQAAARAGLIPPRAPPNSNPAPAADLAAAAAAAPPPKVPREGHRR
jgi:hypothetical protein